MPLVNQRDQPFTHDRRILDDENTEHALTSGRITERHSSPKAAVIFETIFGLSPRMYAEMAFVSGR
jgi:hypothetical protein